jgi:hypothetical protein
MRGRSRGAADPVRELRAVNGSYPVKVLFPRVGTGTKPARFVRDAPLSKTVAIIPVPKESVKSALGGAFPGVPREGETMVAARRFFPIIADSS